MSGFEQHVEAPDRRWQYLLFAAEPYETISFKVYNLLFHFLRHLSSHRSRFPVVKSINPKENSGLTTTQKPNKYVLSFFFKIFNKSSIVSSSSSFNFPSNSNRINIPAIIHPRTLEAMVLHLLLHLVHYVIRPSIVTFSVFVVVLY